MQSKITLGISAAAFFAVIAPAMAHHSFAMFDNTKTITLTGAALGAGSSVNFGPSNANSYFDTGLTDGLGTNPGALYYPLPGTAKLDWGLSQLNLNNSFTASVLYDLPFGKGKKYGSSWSGATNAVLCDHPLCERRRGRRGRRR